MIEQHVAKIEDVNFQTQFLAIGGYSVLELVLEHHEFSRSLVAAVSCGEVELEEIYKRVLCLLPLVGEEETSHDGSIVVYLHCLALFDLKLAYEASVLIRETAGLFWSRRMALVVVKRFWEEQIRASAQLCSSFGRQAVKLGRESNTTTRISSPYSSSLYSTGADSRRYVRRLHPVEMELSARVA